MSFVSFDPIKSQFAEAVIDTTSKSSFKVFSRLAREESSKEHTSKWSFLAPFKRDPLSWDELLDFCKNIQIKLFIIMKKEEVLLEIK